MPVPKKKRATSKTTPSTSEQSATLLPEQQAFHQHLHALAQSDVRTVIELVMREELDVFIGACAGSIRRSRTRSVSNTPSGVLGLHLGAAVGSQDAHRGLLRRPRHPGAEVEGVRPGPW
jgi:hypothetical protein